MLFNSLDFAIFLPVVFAVYWIIGRWSLLWQNTWIVIASCVFYGWWDWRFLVLLMASATLDYGVGRWLEAVTDPKWRRYLLAASLVVNFGLLGFFKYYNFFLDNFVAAFTWWGQPIEARPLAMVLPVGISFYTFQTVSYTIDVYRRQLQPTRSLLAFWAYVSFFPQLVAGPIERATHLLPQFFAPRRFDYAAATDGLRQMLWGFFKKLVIADNCAIYANMTFGDTEAYGGSTLLIGVIFFAFQIYGDFSGYSDIAIGTARLFGFSLSRNFAFPYFARDMAEFWRRWHISLSTWFRDYVYVPLGGNQGNRWHTMRNMLVVFVLSGFWHGANWTYIVWALLHAAYYLPLVWRGVHRKHIQIVAQGQLLPSLQEAGAMLHTFTINLLTWVFFRATDMTHAFQYIKGVLSFSLFTVPRFEGIGHAGVTAVGVLFMLTVEWIGRESEYALAGIGTTWWRGVRWVWYALIVFLIGMFMQTEETPFIYFQF